MIHHTRGLLVTCGIALSFNGWAQPAPQESLSTRQVRSLFQDVTWEWGLHSQHQQRRESLAGLTETLGAGACVLDFNHDSWMDLLLVGGSGQRREFGAAAWWQPAQGHRLYRNEAGTGFVDVTAESGLEPGWGMGCATADWDADGDEDLLITGYNNTLLYKNEGGGRFLPMPTTGIAPEGWATSASVADYDGDGRLDIYITYFIDYQRGQRTFEASAGFKPGLPASFNPALHDAQANRLYRNLGALQFEEVTATAAVTNSEGRSLQGLWAHLNGDEAPDLVVINAHGSPAVVYLNDQRGGFTATDSHWKFSLGEGLQGVAWLPGSRHTPARLVATTGSGDALSIASHPDSPPLNPWDAGLARDVDLAYTGWGVATGDFDNNGFLDIVTANGAPLPDPDATNQPLGQPNMIYQGRADGHFTALRLGSVKESSRGVISLDANNDGALDLLVTNNNDAPQLLLNTHRSKGHWLGLAFQDNRGNPITHGIGVTLTGEGWALTRQLSDRQGYLSTSEPRLHIGLGAESTIDELQIRWPDGSRSLIPQPPVNGYLTLRQGQQRPLAVKPAAVALDTPLQQHRRFYRQFNQLYIDLVVRAGPDPDHQRFLHQVTLESASALATAIRALPERPQADWFFLLRRGIESADLSAQLSTLDTLQRWELEASVRYLLPLLTHEDAAIQCRTAQVFEAFFREEEAVIHRKYLAVPNLVQLLEHRNPSVQICAMQALAEAERFRGLHPLLELVANTNPDVARQAVRTLGRIRQREAVPALEALAAELAPDSKLRPEVEWALAQLTANTLAQARYQTQSPDQDHDGRQDQGRRQGRFEALATPTSVLTATQQSLLSRLLQQYGSPSATSERALLSELEALEDVQVWNAFLDTVAAISTARGKRVLLKNLHHQNTEVITTVIGHSDPLISDPRYDQSLWRLLVSPNYPKPARLALAYKLGQQDAQRVIALLPEMEKTR